MPVEGVSLLLEMVMAVSPRRRIQQPCSRYLLLLLGALGSAEGAQVPGWPPTWLELAAPWETN